MRCRHSLHRVHLVISHGDSSRAHYVWSTFHSDQRHQRPSLSDAIGVTQLDRPKFHVCISSFVEYRLLIHTLFDAVWTQPWNLTIMIRYFLLPNLFSYKLASFTPTGFVADDVDQRKARSRQSRLCLVPSYSASSAVYTRRPKVESNHTRGLQHRRVP